MTARQIQTNKTEFVCPASNRPQSAGSERRSTARQIQSKRTEFRIQNSSVCCRPGLSPLARNCARRPDRFSRKELNSSVCRRFWPLTAGSERRSTARQIQSKRTEFRIRLSVVDPASDRWLGIALDGQTDSVKKNRIRLSVVDPASDRWLGTTLDGQTDSVKKNRIRLSVVDPASDRWLGEDGRVGRISFLMHLLSMRSVGDE